MPSKGELTRERIVAEATRLVHRKGFGETSMSDLMEATGLKKGCLYFHFSDKEDLSLAVLQKAKEDFFTSFDFYLAEKTPADRLEHVLKGTLELNRRRNFDGCIFGNTALEMSGKNKRLSGFVGEVFEEWIGRMTKIVKDAQDAGRVKTGIPAAVLAKHIVMSLEGGIMLSRLGKNEKPLKDCVASLKTLLEMK